MEERSWGGHRGRGCHGGGGGPRSSSSLCPLRQTKQNLRCQHILTVAVFARPKNNDGDCYSIGNVFLFFFFFFLNLKWEEGGHICVNLKASEKRKQKEKATLKGIKPERKEKNRAK